MGDSVLTRSGGADSLTTSLILEIAEEEGVDPIELSPPLNTVIDLDGLKALFRDSKDGFVRVEFTYAGHLITIEGDENVHIEVA